MKTPLKVSGAIFLLVSLLHILRLIFKIPVAAAGYTVPMFFSVIGALAALVLAVWMFNSARQGSSAVEQ
jgi:hypothetical protein